VRFDAWQMGIMTGGKASWSDPQVMDVPECPGAWRSSRSKNDNKERRNLAIYGRTSWIGRGGFDRGGPIFVACKIGGYGDNVGRRTIILAVANTHSQARDSTLKGNNLNSNQPDQREKSV
jgi:hypothetical protein